MIILFIEISNKLNFNMKMIEIKMKPEFLLLYNSLK
jgi:hypothetical protein